MEEIIDEVLNEVNRQSSIGNADLDKTNTQNDWIAYITAYAGRAADKCFRNQKEGQDFRTNMIKVAALAISAIKANDDSKTII